MKQWIRIGTKNDSWYELEGTPGGIYRGGRWTKDNPPYFVTIVPERTIRSYLPSFLSNLLKPQTTEKQKVSRPQVVGYMGNPQEELKTGGRFRFSVGGAMYVSSEITSLGFMPSLKEIKM